MDSKSLSHIDVLVRPEHQIFYTSLLQSGVLYSVKQGQSVGNFICSLTGFNIDYIEKVVQTIFLDGSPVDNIARVFYKGEHVLALSAAMPGLAGAILRRNGLHSSLRMDFKEDEAATMGAPCNLRVKIFNSIAQERGPALLQEGLRFPVAKLYKSLSIRESLLEKAVALSLDEQAISYGALLAHLQGDKTMQSTIQLSVKVYHEKSH